MQNPTVRSTSSGLMMKTQKLQEGQSIKMETAKAKKSLRVHQESSGRGIRGNTANASWAASAPEPTEGSVHGSEPGDPG